MNNSIESIERYLSRLKKALSGSDRATIQDALADAEEYLTTALNTAMEAEPGIPADRALAAIIEKYGEPEEVAAAYRDIESRTPPAFVRPVYQEKETPEVSAAVETAVPDTRPWYTRFFGIVADPRAWGALLYLLFSLCTGVIYYTWAITGLSLSFGLLILIIGLPFAVLFLLTVRGISLAEGRIVEALLGVRMPRRPLYQQKSTGWWPRLKRMLTDRYTWLSIVYMIVQMPLGIIYFTVFITLIALSVFGIFWPFIQLALDVPFSNINGTWYYLTGWAMPLSILAGALLLILTMHLAKFLGQTHGKLAKVLLVRI